MERRPEVAGTHLLGTSAGLISSLMGPLHDWNGYAARGAHEALRRTHP